MEKFNPSKELLSEPENLLRHYSPAELSRIVRNCFMEQGYYLCAEGIGFTADHQIDFLYLGALFRFLDVAAKENLPGNFSKV